MEKGKRIRPILKKYLGRLWLLGLVVASLNVTSCKTTDRTVKPTVWQERDAWWSHQSPWPDSRDWRSPFDSL